MANPRINPRIRNTTCVTEVDPTFCEGYDAALALLRRAPRPTALFCANDSAARGAFRAAAELGLAIPRDLSVVGFADLDLASFLSPSLTTLRQQPEEIGRRAAQLLLDRIAEPRAGRDPASYVSQWNSLCAVPPQGRHGHDPHLAEWGVPFYNEAPT